MENDNAMAEGDPGNANLPIGAVENQRHQLPTPAFAWRSRGYLPHLDSPNRTQHVTFHLADSLPRIEIKRIAAELEFVDPERRDVEKRKQLERLVDAGYGSCLLKHGDIADMVQSALLHFDGKRYQMFAWVVMPNHVHTLFQPIGSWTVSKIVASWKKFTARRFNEMLKAEVRSKANQEIGVPRKFAPSSLPIRVWHREYWDRFIRDETHFHAAKRYIEENPVKAGLTSRAEEWNLGSALFRKSECD